MAKKGFIQLLGIFALALIVLAIVGGFMSKSEFGSLSVSGMSLPDCEFGKATKGTTFMLEDFSRNGQTITNEYDPAPTGWTTEKNDNSLRFDATLGKVKCDESRCLSVVENRGRGECVCKLGYDDALGVGGSYSGGKVYWDLYETKLNIKQQPMQIDIKNIKFSSSSIIRSDLGTVYQNAYLTDGITKVRLFSWGNGGDLASEFNAEKMRICVDPKRETAYVNTLANGAIYSTEANLVVLKSSDEWYLGFEGEVKGTPKYLSITNAEESNATNLRTAETLSMSGGEYKSIVGVTSNTYIDDIEVTPYTAPIEIPLPLHQPELNEPPSGVGTQSSNFFTTIKNFFQLLFSPITNLFN